MQKIHYSNNNHLENRFSWIFMSLAMLLLLALLSGCGRASYGPEANGAVDNVRTDASPQYEQMFEKSLMRALEVSHWVDTGIYTVGSARDQDGQEVTVPLKIQVTGRWYPFGQTKGQLGKPCELLNCDPGEEGCFTKSNTPGLKSDGKKLAFQIGENKTNKGCYLEKGQGLYGLIVDQEYLDKNADGDTGVITDPNKNIEVASNPSAYPAFRVFHFADIKSNVGESEIYLLKSTQKCTKSNEGDSYKCEQDTAGTNGVPTIISGKIYVKLYDVYYGDNVGGYDLQFLSGFYFNGLISNSMKIMDRILQNSAKLVYQKVLLKLANLLRVLMALFVVLQILVFVLGMSRDSKAQLLTSLIKFTFVMFFLSEASFEFFYENFFGLFRNIPNRLADLISSSALFVNNDLDPNYKMSFNLVLPRAAGYLAMFDTMFAILLSPAIHAKIWALFFTSKILWIFLLYVLLLIVMQSIASALVVFFVAIIRSAILITISPLCIIFLLYNIFGHVYQNWLKYMINNGVAIILNTMVVAALFRLIDNSIYEIFKYGMDTGYFLGFIPYYKVTNWDEVNVAINVNNYVIALLSALLFSFAVRKVPSLADSISELSFGTFSGNVGVFESKATNLLSRGMGGAINVGHGVAGWGGNKFLELYEKKYNNGNASFLRRAGAVAAQTYDMVNSKIDIVRQLEGSEQLLFGGRQAGFHGVENEMKQEKQKIDEEVRQELKKIKGLVDRTLENDKREALLQAAERQRELERLAAARDGAGGGGAGGGVAAGPGLGAQPVNPAAQPGPNQQGQGQVGGQQQQYVRRDGINNNNLGGNNPVNPGGNNAGGNNGGGI